MNLEKRSVLLTMIFIYLVLPSKGQSPYISHIPEYRPAPGQHINDPLTGTPGAANLLTGGISTPVSLGAYGGYIIFGFDHTIENDPHNPYGIDFTIFGNAFQGSSEPGIVRVMKDENGNGLPDDTWYEIAGSRHYTGTLMPHYRITYFNTASQDSGDILWTDNLNDSGYVSRNEFHNQPLYPASDNFPDVNQDSMSFYGSRIYMSVSSDHGILKTGSSLFGYADNHAVNITPDGPGPDNPYTPGILEGTGGDAIDISWAVDAGGHYTTLDGIDFIMVQTAVNAEAGPLGEISTDITGVMDVAPDPGLMGETRLISLEKIPEVLPVNAEYAVEPLIFENGRPVNGEFILSCSDPSIASIENENTLVCHKGGEFDLSAKLSGDEQVTAVKKIRVVQITSLSAGRNFGFLFAGERGVVTYSFFDQDGNRIDDITPLVTVADTGIAKVSGIHPGQADLTARAAGKTTLTVMIPGMENLSKTLDITVIDNSPPEDISVSVKLDEESLISRTTCRIQKLDINPYVSNNPNLDLVPVTDFISLADVITTVFQSHGYTSGGQVFRFRKDEYSGNRLYLWQVGKDWSYTYGWGGNMDSGPFRKCWTASVNGTAYLNDFDHIHVKSGDVVSVYYVEDILQDWEDLSLCADRQETDPGDSVTLTYSLSHYSVNNAGELQDLQEDLPGSAFVYSNGQPLGTVAELAGPDDHDMTIHFDHEGIYNISVEGYPAEVIRIDAGNVTGLQQVSKPQTAKVYPVPFRDYISVSLSKNEACTVLVTDLTGRVLFLERLTGRADLNINTSGFQPGVYILGIRYRSGSENRILVKP